MTTTFDTGVPSGDTLPSEEEVLADGSFVGDYVIESLLGSGGFARVYRARHRTLGGLVAIKVLARSLSFDPEAMRRFLREAQSASRIAHPGIVRAQGFGKLEDGRAYQVMELVVGPSLDTYLEQRGRLSTTEAITLLEQIASALSAAHAASIVHRDLKPSNILLAATPEGGTLARLTDFGIAKALEDDTDPRLTRTGNTLGTPTYMSPEQALGRAITPASDVYSFGVVAFELLAGKVPFDGESAFAIMMKHVQDPRPLASAVDPDLGTSFDAILERMLDRSPENRPGLQEAMQAFLATREQRPPRTRAIGRLAIGAVVASVVGLVVWRGIVARDEMGGPPVTPTAIPTPRATPSSAPPTETTPTTTVPATTPTDVTPAPSPTSTKASPPSTTAPTPAVSNTEPPNGTRPSTAPKPKKRPGPGSKDPPTRDSESYEQPEDYAP